MNPVQAIRTVAGWSQVRLAGAAGTSQPAIAAYESESKSPTWRTVERLANAAGLACYPFVGSPMTRDQARSLALHRAIADRLLRKPDHVREIARRNVTTMRDANRSPLPLIEEWARVLELTPVQIAVRLLDPSEHGRDMRQVTPFAGVLSAGERTNLYRSFRAAT